jgi:hypothetical protein
MAMYYFHLRDCDNRLIDEEGRELAPEMLNGACLREARHMISADALTGKIDLTCGIDVEDEGGKVVHRCSFASAVEIKPAR